MSAPLNTAVATERPQALRLVDALPDVWDREQADRDYRTALAYRNIAHSDLRWQLPGWRYQHRTAMHAAIKAWQRYSRTIRKWRVQ